MSETDRPEPFDERGEPALLGAAATLPVERQSRKQRRAAASSGPKSPDRRVQAPATPTPAPEGSVDLADYSGVESVFEPHASTVPPLRPYLRSLWERRKFMMEMAKAQVRGKRSSTALGSLWGILDPLFQAGIYFMLYSIIRGGSGDPLDYLHTLIAGIFLFQLATAALMDGGTSVRQSSNLMLNSAFPRAILPLGAVYKGLLKFLPTIGVYVFLHLMFQAPVGWSLLLIPPLFGLQLLLMVGMAMLAATLVVYFRDAQNFMTYVTRILFFTSPVIFQLKDLDALSGTIRMVMSFQPLFALFASYQTVLNGEIPGIGTLLQVVGWAVAFLVFGGWIFLRHERDFASHL